MFTGSAAAEMRLPGLPSSALLSTFAALCVRPAVWCAHAGRAARVASVPILSADAASTATTAASLRDRLCVCVSTAELGDGALTPETLRAATDAVAEHGVVLLRGALDRSTIDSCRAAAMRALDMCVAELKSRGVDYRSPLAFREVVHRAPLRYDVSLQSGTALSPLPPADAAALQAALYQPLVRRLLGADALHNFDGAFIALPGAGEQAPHMDGGHLFRAPLRRTGEARQIRSPAHITLPQSHAAAILAHEPSQPTRRPPRKRSTARPAFARRDPRLLPRPAGAHSQRLHAAGRHAPPDG